MPVFFVIFGLVTIVVIAVLLLQRFDRMTDPKDEICLGWNPGIKNIE
jgi:hypothetical protein